MFLPKFQVSTSIEMTAYLINRPHEDYPKRVDVTAEVLESVLSLVPNSKFLSTHDIKTIHQKVMWDLPVDRGTWRTCNVRVGSSIPPAHYKVEERLIAQGLERPERFGWAGRKPWTWYKEFQEVHPFRDGNGRVGGIVLAFLTFDPDTGIMLAPCQ